MNKYIGKICPYCKAKIKEGDDIVVCSICDMPHHKECWIDNQGCTTFGCTGTISTPKRDDTKSDEDDFEIVIYDDDFSIQEQFMCCPICGAQNIKGSIFCCKCGNPFLQEVFISQSMINNELYCQTYKLNDSDSYSGDSDLALLIGKNASYYITHFSTIKLQGKKASWNWSAFLITPYWMIYRKMYGYGAGILSGLFLLSLFGGWVSYLLQIVAYTVFGILGNYIYLDFLDKKVVQLNLLSGEYKNSYITKNGGTNTTAAILCAVGYIIFVGIVLLA